MTTTIALIGQKGGTGKTTVAVCLAVAAAMAGHRVEVIDADQQGSATTWGRRRSAPPAITVTPSTVGALRRNIEAARGDDCDLLIIDSPGKNDSAATEAAREADLVLIPCEPSPFATDTLPTVRENVRAAGSPPAFVVYNRVHPHGHRIADELKALTLDGYGLAPCPVHLSMRNVYIEVTAYGKSPAEMGEEGAKAAAEIEALWAFVLSQLPDLQRIPHGKTKRRA